jgi:translation initiation factor 2 beta subunit (eIF-2beta)/eIF-5
MVSKKLEEQIQQLSQKIILLEKELGQLHQACDSYKRHAIDNVQLIQELKLSSQKYLCQLKEAQSQIGEKSELVAAQTFTNKRAQEEIKHLQVYHHPRYLQFTLQFTLLRTSCIFSIIL